MNVGSTLTTGQQLCYGLAVISCAACVMSDVTPWIREHRPNLIAAALMCMAIARLLA